MRGQRWEHFFSACSWLAQERVRGTLPTATTTASLACSRRVRLPLSLLLSRDEKRRWDAAAKKAGQSLGLWLREAAEMRRGKILEALERLKGAA